MSNQEPDRMGDIVAATLRWVVFGSLVLCLLVQLWEQTGPRGSKTREQMQQTMQGAFGR